jgi:hypothetical protein
VPKCSETESSYMGGCRCSGCRKAHTDRERDRRTIRRKNTGTEEDSAVPQRLHKRMHHDTLTLKELREARGYDD